MKVKTVKEQIKREYSCVQKKVKNLRKKFSETVTRDRNDSEQIAIDHYDEMWLLWLKYGVNLQLQNHWALEVALHMAMVI